MEIQDLRVESIKKMGEYKDCGGELEYRPCNDTGPSCNYSEGEYLTYEQGDCQCVKCISDSGDVQSCPPGYWVYVPSGGCYNYCMTEGGYAFFQTHFALDHCCYCHD